MTQSASQILKRQIVESGLPTPTLEHRFCGERKWAFDFAWPDRKIAFEIEGGAFAQGRHTRGKGFTRDIEKYNTAGLAGWLLLRATSEQVRSGKAIEWIVSAIAGDQHD